MESPEAVELLQMSVADGRTENGRWRQRQLQELHKVLREEAGQICSALLADSQSTSAEVETEYYLAMDALRHFYEGVNFEDELEEEYSVAHGKDNLDRRIGVGMVVLKPTGHTRFYSIITPLAAAIAAGNCVILEVCGHHSTLHLLKKETPYIKPPTLLIRLLPASRYRAAGRLCPTSQAH